MRQSFSIWKAVPEYGQGKRPEKAGEAEIKKVQIFTNVYQKFEDFEAKPFTKVIKNLYNARRKHCMGKPYPYGAPSYIHCVTEG